SERLAKRHGDGERAIALLAVEWDAKVDADRAEARIIADAEPGCGAPMTKVRARRRGQCAAVEEGHQAEIAAELLQPDARFEAELGEPTTTDRITVQVLGSELLIAIAPDRAAAAGIETT